MGGGEGLKQGGSFGNVCSPHSQLSAPKRAPFQTPFLSPHSPLAPTFSRLSLEQVSSQLPLAFQ